MTETEEEIKRFEIPAFHDKDPDLIEVIEWINKQDYFLCEIERAEVHVRDTGTAVLVIKRVNPPRSPLARIDLMGYFLASDGPWDVRKIFFMWEEMKKKIKKPHHKEE